MPSLPVLIDALKFISSNTISKLPLASKKGICSGFFSVTTSLTSVRNNRRTAVNTSISSSITRMFVFLRLMQYLFIGLLVYRFIGLPVYGFMGLLVYSSIGLLVNP